MLVKRFWWFDESGDGAVGGKNERPVVRYLGLLNSRPNLNDFGGI